MNHIANQIRHPELVTDSTLHVVSPISNPVRYHSRYRLARQYIEAMAATPGVKLHIVETAYGHRAHELRDFCENLGVDYLGLRTRSSVWIKESMINVDMRRVIGNYPEAQFLSWIDADVLFRDPSWALETVQQLQHFSVVQPWSECLDLGPRNEGMQMFTSFGKLHQRGVKKQKVATDPYDYGHCGYAWACTRAFWESVGGLIDSAILGAADYMMAWACIGESAGTSWGMGNDFAPILANWERRAVRVSKKQVGFVNGVIEHQFHGSKVNRYYQSRNKIMVKHGFNAQQDLYYDEQGLIQLYGKPDLENDIHRYNLSRDEDGITLP